MPVWWRVRLVLPNSQKMRTALRCGSSWPKSVVEPGHAQTLEMARFGLVEDLRAEAATVVRALADAGLSVQMLSGDRPEAVQRVAAQAGITEARGACTPQDKLAALQSLQAQGHLRGHGGRWPERWPCDGGSPRVIRFGRAVPLARSRADFVVLRDSLTQVPQAVLLARKTLQIVRQNLWWAAGYNALCVPLAVVGWMPAWLAGLGMALSSLLVVLNAARLQRDCQRRRVALMAIRRLLFRRQQGVHLLPCRHFKLRSRLMDILYLLIPLSVVLVLMIPACGGLCTADSLKVWNKRGAHSPRRLTFVNNHNGSLVKTCIAIQRGVRWIFQKQMLRITTTRSCVSSQSWPWFGGGRHAGGRHHCRPVGMA